jgi:hypothetical protein
MDGAPYSMPATLPLLRSWKVILKPVQHFDEPDFASRRKGLDRKRKQGILRLLHFWSAVVKTALKSVGSSVSPASLLFPFNNLRD